MTTKFEVVFFAKNVKFCKLFLKALLFLSPALLLVFLRATILGFADYGVNHIFRFEVLLNE